MIVRGLLSRGCEVNMSLGSDGPWRERISADCPVDVVPHKNWLRRQQVWRFFKDLFAEHRSAGGFEKVFAQNRPDLVYLNSLVCYAPAVAARRLGIPVIWHIRELFSDVGGEMTWPNRIPKQVVRRRIVSLADRLIVNSEAVRCNVFGEEGVPRPVVIPNGVGEVFFRNTCEKSEAREGFGLPLDQPVVGVPATFRPMKGHEFFVRSVPKVLERVPHCTFAFTGAIDSPFARSLQEQIQAQPFSDRIVFTGVIQDMPQFYRACDVCCVPSSSEPFGRTAIECMASGVPLVASAVGGLKEIVQHEQNGLLVEYGDVCSLADSVVLLLMDSLVRERLVSRALQDAVENYSASVYTDRVIGVINDVLRPHSKSV